MPHCKQTKEDGTPCQTNAMAGSDYCFFHDPAKADEREAARRAGGSVGKTAVLPPDAPDVSLSSVANVIVLLGLTVNQVRRGQIDPKVANAIGYLTATLLRALEQGDIEKRVAELEALVKGHAAPESVFDEDLEGDVMEPDLPAEVTA